jgi:hypothetical protein
MRTEGQYNHATVLKIHVIDCFFLRNSSYTVCVCAPGVSDKDQVRLDVGEDGQTLTISAKFEINCVGSILKSQVSENHLVGLLAAIDVSRLILCLAGQDKRRTSCEGGFEGWLNVYNLANSNSEITG